MEKGSEIHIFNENLQYFYFYGYGAHPHVFFGPFALTPKNRFGLFYQLLSTYQLSLSLPVFLVQITMKK